MTTIAELTRQVMELDGQIALLRERREQIAQELADAMDAKRVEIEGIGAVERYRRATRKTWAHHDLARSVASRVHENRKSDPLTGEVESEAEATLRLLESAARFEWRVTVLRGLGIDPDEYCETTYEPGWSVRVPPVKKEDAA